jgi:hypothetical protein
MEYKVLIILLLESNYFLVMELLGPNLSDLMKMCGGKFTLNTTIYLAMQIVYLFIYLVLKNLIFAFERICI